MQISQIYIPKDICEVVVIFICGVLEILSCNYSHKKKLIIIIVMVLSTELKYQSKSCKFH